MPKCHQPLKFSDLNSFLTKFCDNYQRHDYSSCLQWHSNMSPQFSQVEVKKKHLRRVPVKLTGPDTAVLLYENEKCPNPDTCPEKSNCNKVCFIFLFLFLFFIFEKNEFFEFLFLFYVYFIHWNLY